MTIDPIAQVIHQFEGKIRAINAENEDLRLQVHKSNVVAAARLEQLEKCQKLIIKFESDGAILESNLAQLAAELADSTEVIRTLSADNRSIRSENESVVALELELRKEREKATIFQNMYYQLEKHRVDQPVHRTVFSPTPQKETLDKRVQTESLLTLEKSTWINN
jgi:predicted RNase H-like nuclease (RuvC/YqgF family)